LPVCNPISRKQLLVKLCVLAFKNILVHCAMNGLRSSCSERQEFPSGTSCTLGSARAQKPRTGAGLFCARGGRRGEDPQRVQACTETSLPKNQAIAVAALITIHAALRPRMWHKAGVMSYFGSYSRSTR